MPMNKRQIILSLVMTALMAAFMAISPGYIAGDRMPLTLQREAENIEDYQGIITIWHIVGFKPYQGSLGSWMSSAAAQFEKKHRGVYFEVDSITEDEYDARIARGEQPDVFSFSLGKVYVDQLREMNMEIPELKGNLFGIGCSGGKLYAVPYAASGYLLMHNQRLVQEMGMDADGMADMLKSGNASAAGNAVCACVYGAAGELLTEEDFLEEKAASAFMDARAAGDLQRKVQNGKGFPFEAAPCGNYSDLVQLIGINVNAHPDKLGCIYELIELCLSQENQMGLCDIGLMPAVAEIQPDKADEGAVELLFEELSDIAAPNSFLYQTYREQLGKSAREAMLGSAAAKKDLDLRLTELVRGAEIH